MQGDDDQGIGAYLNRQIDVEDVTLPKPNSVLAVVFSIILIGLVLMIYVLPCIVCSMRGATNGGTVFIVNLLFGWTLIGWVTALIIVCISQTKTSVAIEKETLRRLKSGG